MPMIREPRYLINSLPAFGRGVPACLRYAIWANAASASPEHAYLKDVFYQRAQKYAENDEVRVCSFYCDFHSSYKLSRITTGSWHLLSQRSARAMLGSDRII